MKRATTACAFVLLLCAATALADGDDALATNGCTPSGNLRGDATRGAALHEDHCAECHGLDGKANVIVMHMDEPPKDQSDAAYMSTLSDAFLYLAICKGGKAVGRSVVMPAWGDYFTDQQIKDLIARIRSFSGT